MFEIKDKKILVVLKADKNTVVRKDAQEWIDTLGTEKAMYEARLEEFKKANKPKKKRKKRLIEKAEVN